MIKLKYYKNLDSLRAIAACMVILYHFFTEIQINTQTLFQLRRISTFGQTGVILFFVLSGFLITRILIATKDENNYFKNFYIKRTLRIFPLYYLFLLIFYFVYPVLFKIPYVTFGQQIYYYTYLQGFALTFGWPSSGPGNYWSLAVEEHFYLFWPLLIYFFSNKNLLRFVIFIILGDVLLRVFMLFKGIEIYHFTFTRFDSLAIGSLLALIEVKGKLTEKYSKNFLFISILTIIPTVILWMFLSGSENIIVKSVKFSLISVVYFAIIGYLLSIKNDHLINNFLNKPIISYTGKISYGLYIYHPFAFAIARKWFNTDCWPFDLFLGFILTYIMSVISYHFFETYFLSFKRYFNR